VRLCLCCLLLRPGASCIPTRLTFLSCLLLQVPELQQLNLFGCRRASGLQLQAVLQTLPQLRSIDLNGCWNIHSLHLTGEACGGYVMVMLMH
jgi:hypothetical protein